MAFGLIGLFLSLSAWAVDYCPVLLERLRDYEKVGQFTALTDRRSFRKFYGIEETRYVVESIENLKAFSFQDTFELTGSAKEADGTLTIRLDGIGPKRGAPLPPASIKEQKGALAGLYNPFRPERGANPRMIKAVAAVLEGVDRRLKANPSTKKVVFITVDVMNPVLKSMLSEKMGLQFVAWKSIGLSESAATMRLEIELAPPR